MEDIRVGAHSLIPEGLSLELAGIGFRGITVRARSGANEAPCPACSGLTTRVHSTYTRTVADLLWRGTPVTLRVRVRKFFCDEASCERKIFCERLEEIAVRGRKTSRLEEALLTIAFELGQARCG